MARYKPSGYLDKKPDCPIFHWPAAVALILVSVIFVHQDGLLSQDSSGTVRDSSATGDSILVQEILQSRIESLHEYHAALRKLLKRVEADIDSLKEAYHTVYGDTVSIPSYQHSGRHGTDKQAPPPEVPPLQAMRCSAFTKKGARCSRTTTDKSGRCWQHRR